MKMKVTVRFQCELCGREWEKKVQALLCEGSPPPALRVGDVVLWRGKRSASPFSTLVYDTVVEIKLELLAGVPGHRAVYRLAHDYSVRESALRGPRSGYVTLAGGLGYAGSDTNRIEVSLRNDPDAARLCEELVAWLASLGVPLQGRIARLYQAARKMEYERTWDRALWRAGDLGRPRRRIAYRLANEQAQALAWLAREPSDEECLVLIGGVAYRDRSGPHPPALLDGAFEGNRFQAWAGAVGFDLTAAIDQMARATDGSLIALVRGYRARLLAGGAHYERRETLEGLFPLDETKATGKWPEAMLRLAAHFGVQGSGLTRLRRLYGAAVSHEEKEEMPAEERDQRDYALLWPGVPVVAVFSGKGGTGKSSVTADLARELSARGKRVLVVDLDFTGPSQPILFPVGDPRLATREQKIVPHLVDGVQVVSLGHLLGEDEPLLWRGHYLEMLLHLFGTALETDAEIVLLDLPPGTGDVFQAVLTLCPQALFVVVTTAGQLALADTRRAVSALSGDQRARIVGVVENMSYKDLPEPVGRIRLFGREDDVPAMARAFHLRFLGALPIVDQELEVGLRREALARTVLPVALDCLAGRRYQEVALSSITEQADRFLQEYTGEEERARGLTWGLDNIAGFLESWILQAGGNPDDARPDRAHRRRRRLLR
jgi:Mrp family chromosome partitioning ATPase